MQKRDTRIDFARAFACIMVLFCHAPQHYLNQGGKFLVGIDNYFGMAWGPILFFVISGACIFWEECDVFSFLKRRFSRILLPTLFWSVVYILIEVFCWHTAQPKDLIFKLPMVLISPQYGLFWFMYALVGVYLTAPVVSRWLHNCSQNEILFYLLLWSFTLLLPYFEVMGFDFNQVVSTTGVLCYMNGFLGYAIAGYYCRKYITITKHKIVSYVFLFLLIVLSPLAVFIIKKNTGRLLDYSGCILPMCTTLSAFIVIMNSSSVVRVMSGKFKKIVLFVSRYSFGIYLTHMLFMYPFRLWILQYQLNYIFQIPITVLVVGILSVLFTWLLSRIPFTKYLI